jgi:negative regulator of flagellin synthesis FlgM
LDTATTMTLERSHDANETGSGSAGTTMKITNGPINNGIRNARNEALEKRSAAGAGSEKSRAQGADRVELSAGLMEVEKLTETIAAMPGSNVDKIESIKNRIADGSYNVSGHAVAEKMLRSMGILKGGAEE